MKLCQLKASNVFNLKVVDITPGKDGVTLTGKNGKGKSNILSTIDLLIRGGKACPKEPLRKGSEKGEIIGDFGDFVARRTITEKGMTISIKTKDGCVRARPQEYFDKLCGPQFDLMEFVQTDSKKQRSILMDLIGVNVDEFDKRISALSDERVIIGRDVKSLKGQLDGSPFVDGVPETETNPVDLINELSKANAHNNQFEGLIQSVAQLTQRVNSGKADIQRKQLEIEEAKARLERWTSSLAESIKEQGKLEESLKDAQKKQKAFVPLNTKEIQDKIDQYQTVNQTVRQNAQHNKIKGDLDKKQAEYEGKTAAIDAVEKEKIEILQKAKFPIEDLSVGPECVLYKGVPLEQASDGEKIIVAMAIFMALNPELKIIRIRNASLLDSDNKKLAREFAKKNGYQAWIEEVESTDTKDGYVTITIEDGETVEVKE